MTVRPAQRVLFLGNSHTYYHDMPRMVELLAAASGQELATEASTGSGVDLAWHWNQRRSRQLLEESRWDVVVLQDRSGGPLENPASMLHHGRLLAERAQANSATTMLYLTWAHRRRPETQAAITEAYRTLARATKSRVAPVGLVWERLLRSPDPVALHDADDRHASPTGSYAAACVFASLLTGETAQGWPATLSDLVHLTGTEARKIQDACDEVLAAEK